MAISSLPDSPGRPTKRTQRLQRPANVVSKEVEVETEEAMKRGFSSVVKRSYYLAFLVGFPKNHQDSKKFKLLFTRETD